MYERVPTVTAKGPLGAVLSVLLSPTLDVFLVSAFWHVRNSMPGTLIHHLHAPTYALVIRIHAPQGFYPGYYVFFIYLAIEVSLARGTHRTHSSHTRSPRRTDARRLFRWRFLSVPALKTFYDVLTWAMTSFVTGVGGLAFLVRNTHTPHVHPFSG